VAASSILLRTLDVTITWSNSALTLQNEQGAIIAVKQAEDGMCYLLAKPFKGEEELALVNTDGKL
jgi:hypothetical protein